ncbi:MAG: heparinase II/III family protein, partial [Gemmatimonadota bacterium]|nr:heparinase II/III family protein [Gemmatimonadota bacterium]
GDVLWDTSDLPFEAQGPDETWPLGRHFEGLGWVVMRSGWDPDATHSIFNCGNQYYGHQHADENSFVIFKKGTLAIDSGRYEWGSDHRGNYMARTIAHNTILVYNRDEVFKSGSTEYVNDGGQKWPRSMPPSYQDLDGTGYDMGDITRFETNRWYSYACGDATRAYSADKMKLFTRQYIHIQPDAFVVFDRVIATSANYKKYWLLHTMNEPEIDGNVVRIHEREGQLFTRTILPENAGIRKVGGRLHAFDVFGVNYPPAGTHYAERTGEERGSWRIEVTPAEEAEEDFFLHLLVAGDSTLSSIPEAALTKSSEERGLSFTYNGLEYEILFNTTGDTAGHIRINDPASGVLLDRALTEEVQPQEGIGRL